MSFIVAIQKGGNGYSFQFSTPCLTCDRVKSTRIFQYRLRMYIIDVPSYPKPISWPVRPRCGKKVNKSHVVSARPWILVFVIRSNMCLFYLHSRAINLTAGFCFCCRFAGLLFEIFIRKSPPV